MRGMGEYLLERSSPAEQRLIWVVFVVAAVALFVGVYRHMGAKMRDEQQNEGTASAVPVPPSPNGAAGGRDRRTPGAGKVLGKAFGSGEELAGVAVLAAAVASLLVYLLLFADFPGSEEAFGYAAGAAAAYALVHATAEPRAWRKPACALWIALSLVGLALAFGGVPPELPTVPPGGDAPGLAGSPFGAPAWLCAARGFCVLALLVSTSKLASLWQEGRWKDF